VPAEEEAGALGAAIQAMVAVARAEGIPGGFPAAAARSTRTDPALTAAPRPGSAGAYRAARAAYQQRLRSLYGVEAGPPAV